MKNTVFFDLDGTLLYTLPTIASYINSALGEYTSEQIPTDAFAHYVGNGAKTLVERSLKHHGITLSEAEICRVLNTYNSAYDAAPYDLTEPYEGITDMLHALKSRGITCAVISNKPDSTTKQVVEHYFPGIFDTVRGALPGVPLKPAPDAVRHIMMEMGVSPDDALFVGDTYVDISTGKNAGIETVGVLWGFRDHDELKGAGADHIISTPAQICEILFD